jgi:HD-like signal output (HDOD) protein
MTITRTSLSELVDRLHVLPSLPEVVAQIAKATADPGTNARQIHELVIKDAAIAAKMLRLVNSVFYGLKEPVRDLEQAVNILGFKTVRSIALSVGVLNAFQQQNACFNMKVFWTHSAVSAAISRMIAIRSRSMDIELAFLAGLLHSLGMLLLAQAAPDETRSIIAVAQEFALPFHRAAREVVDTDEAELGGWLCQHWELEPALVRAVRDQHRLPVTSDPAPVAILQFCTHLCRLKNLRVPGDCSPAQLDPTVWPHLNMDKTALVDLVSAVNDEVEKAKILLSL